EVHPLGPAAMDDAVLVDTDDVADTTRLEDLDGGGAGGADTRHDHAEAPSVLANDLQGVEQGRQHDDRRPVLVVMEDGNIQFLPAPLLDLEAPGRSDVLEVDAAEDRRHELHGLDDRSEEHTSELQSRVDLVC